MEYADRFVVNYLCSVRLVYFRLAVMAFHRPGEGKHITSFNLLLFFSTSLSFWSNRINVIVVAREPAVTHSDRDYVS